MRCCTHTHREKKDKTGDGRKMGSAAAEDCSSLFSLAETAETVSRDQQAASWSGYPGLEDPATLFGSGWVDPIPAVRNNVWLPGKENVMNDWESHQKVSNTGGTPHKSEMVPDEETVMASIENGYFLNCFILPRPLTMLGPSPINRVPKIIHPDYLPLNKVDDAHAAMVDRDTFQNLGGKETTDRIKKMRCDIRTIISTVMDSYIHRACRMVGFGGGGEGTLLRNVDITKELTFRPTLKNIAKMWFVLYGIFDHNKKILDIMLEEDTMAHMGLQYREGCTRLKSHYSKKDEKPELRKGCVQVQIPRVRQSKIKNVNRVLVRDLGISLTIVKPSVNGKQAKRRVLGKFETKFVILVDEEKWRRHCKLVGTFPEICSRFTRIGSAGQQPCNNDTAAKEPPASTATSPPWYRSDMSHPPQDYQANTWNQGPAARATPTVNVITQGQKRQANGARELPTAAATRRPHAQLTAAATSFQDGRSMSHELDGEMNGGSQEQGQQDLEGSDKEHDEEDETQEELHEETVEKTPPRNATFKYSSANERQLAKDLAEAQEKIRALQANNARGVGMKKLAVVERANKREASKKVVSSSSSVCHLRPHTSTPCTNCFSVNADHECKSPQKSHHQKKEHRDEGKNKRCQPRNQASAWWEQEKSQLLRRDDERQ